MMEKRAALAAAKRIYQGCECEHQTHFGLRSPDKGHHYGKLFHKADIRAVRTLHGTFMVCTECARDCLGAFKGEDS